MFERIKYLVNEKGLSGIPELASELGYSSPEKLYRLKKDGAKPSIDIVVDFSNMFEDLDLKWFLTGEGNAFRNKIKTNTKTNTKTDSNTIELHDTRADSKAGYNTKDGIYYERLLEEKDKVILALNEIINTQRETISALKLTIDALPKRKAG